VLWLELDKRDVLLVEALVTHPLGVDLLGEEVEGGLRQARAHSVEPEVAARLTQNCLIIVVHLFMTDAAGIYWWSVGVLGVEDHWLV